MVQKLFFSVWKLFENNNHFQSILIAGCWNYLQIFAKQTKLTGLLTFLNLRADRCFDQYLNTVSERCASPFKLNCNESIIKFTHGDWLVERSCFILLSQWFTQKISPWWWWFSASLLIAMIASSIRVLMCKHHRSHH